MIKKIVETHYKKFFALDAEGIELDVDDLICINWGEALVTDGYLFEQIVKLIELYRNEKMPNWNKPYSYDAEGWATIESFLKWLESKQNER